MMIKMRATYLLIDLTTSFIIYCITIVVLKTINLLPPLNEPQPMFVLLLMPYMLLVVFPIAEKIADRITRKIFVMEEDDND